MAATELKVRLYGDACLRKKSKPVDRVGPAERILIESMLLTMHLHKGIGLAAPQVGINQKIFVVDLGDGPFVFVNPEIVKQSGSEVLEEGCLSIPDVLVDVKRASKIRIKYMDHNNNMQDEIFTEMMARVIQHENDHLNGTMIVDYASLERREEVEPKLKKIEKLQAKKK